MPQTILLVDDEFSFLEVLSFLFAREGFEVLTASDGEEALLRLRERRVDLVVTDFWMPRMSGGDLVGRMQQDASWRDIPVVLMTATYDSEAVRALPVAALLGKPIKFDALLAEVRRVLGGAGRPR